MLDGPMGVAVANDGVGQRWSNSRQGHELAFGGQVNVDDWCFRGLLDAYFLTVP